MAISYVNSGAAAGTTITIPAGHQNGDLLVMWAFDATAVTAATVPSGWTTLLTITGTLCSGLAAWKIAGSNAETSGTWTTATHLACHVYRGTATNKTPIIVKSSQNGTSTSVNYIGTSGGSLMTTPGTSWLVFFSGISTSDTALETAPTGAFNRSNVSSSGEVSGFDTNGPVAAFTTNAVAVGGTSGNWVTRTVEIRAEQVVSRNAGLRPHPFSPGLAR